MILKIDEIVSQEKTSRENSCAIISLNFVCVSQPLLSLFSPALSCWVRYIIPGHFFMLELILSTNYKMHVAYHLRLFHFTTICYSLRFRTKKKEHQQCLTDMNAVSRLTRSNYGQSEWKNEHTKQQQQQRQRKKKMENFSVWIEKGSNKMGDKKVNKMSMKAT